MAGLLMSIFSRKNEFEADAYARQTYAAAPLVDALKKLSGRYPEQPVSASVVCILSLFTPAVATTPAALEHPADIS